jgi:hypothetical protein
MSRPFSSSLLPYSRSREKRKKRAVFFVPSPLCAQALRPLANAAAAPHHAASSEGRFRAFFTIDWIAGEDA